MEESSESEEHSPPGVDALTLNEITFDDNVPRSAPIAIPSAARRASAGNEHFSHSPHHAQPLNPRSSDHLRGGVKSPADEDSSRRRAVSDAAQWLRQKRRSELQKELLPAQAVGARPHHYIWTSGSKPTFCAVCTKVLWSLRQNLKCSECGIEIHKSCQFTAPSCLGEQGSVANFPSSNSMSSPTSMLGVRMTRVQIACAYNLARKNMFRAPDPFAIVIVDNERFQTSVARKTLNPQWLTERDMYISESSTMTIYVFDSKKFREGQWHGFLGMAVIPASCFADSTLGEGATSVYTFRLKKRRPGDVVTGTVEIKVRIMSQMVDLEGSDKTRSPQAVAKLSMASSPHFLATSPGVGWQTLPESLPSSPYHSLIPPPPKRPRATVEDGKVVVQWGDSKEINTKSTGIQFALAYIQHDRQDSPEEIYQGTAMKHVAVGLPAGQEVQFIVSASNFYGSSDFSLPSDPITTPEMDNKNEEEKKHCPMFMAGFCYRGHSCPFYHGSGFQTEEDATAALVAAAFIADPEAQMAAAIAASLTDYTREQGTFDESKLSQNKRDFHKKEAEFRSKLNISSGECHFTVSRADILKTSLFEVSKRTPAQLKQRLVVQFAGEGGLDYGGLAREWFFLLSHEIFHPKYGMFMYCGPENYALAINPDSATNPDHMVYFQFVGRLLALAIVHKHFLDVTFSIVILKQILGSHITLSDLQDVDPDVHRSLIWTLENDISEIPDLTFTADYDSFGEMKTHELKPGGADIEVTEGNKDEFVRLMVQWRLGRGIGRQTAALLHGFYEVIPRELVMTFTERELEFLMCGQRQVDVTDWKANTIYKGFTERSDTVVWFWEIISNYDAEEQSQILQFCTGTSRVPIEGFQALQGSDGPRKFCLQKLDDAERLPSSHTCFNRLDLPVFPTKDILKQKLKTAMECAEGFTGE